MKFKLEMKRIYFLVLFLISWSAFNQELPPIENFTPEDYGADNQNWMISQSDNGFVYAANNKGLLEYNGAKWNTYASPNSSIFRAVKVVGDKIYTGCYSDFGYWEKNEFGNLFYTSLVPKLNNKELEDQQIWNIINYDEWVIFQANSKIYFYDTSSQTFKTITSKNLIYKMFYVNNHLYYHVANEGIYVMEQGHPKLIVSDPIVKNQRVINIFEENNELLLITRNSGFYKIKNNSLVPWKTNSDLILKSTNVFSSIKLLDDSYVLGTISDGVIHLSKDGSLKYQITQKKGLGNNTILSLFEDKKNNLWIGLDNGIDVVNLKSPVSVFIDYEGVLGTVYTSQVFRDYLYLGTNQGVFFRKLNEVNKPFKFIEKTSGQVWSFYNDNNEVLLCGHHLGTFIIEGENANLIDGALGTWGFKKIPKNDNLLLKGNYDGLYVLEKNNKKWTIRNKVQGFKNSARFFEINNQNQVWVSHEHKGIFKLKLNEDFTKVVSTKMEESLPMSKKSSLINYRQSMIYASKEGVYKYKSDEDKFKKDTFLTTLIDSNDYISGKLINDKEGKLWAFSKNNIFYVSTDDLTDSPKINEIPIPINLRKGVSGFENISFLKNKEYLLGTSNGYLILDLDKIPNREEHHIYLNSVNFLDLNDDSENHILNQEGRFDYKFGMIEFNYSVPQFDKYTEVKYQYKLEGQMESWSKWTNLTEITFENLSFGDYNFKVRAKIGNTLSQNTISYSFKVNRPWFISNLAIVIYFLIFISIIILTHKAYKRYYNKMLKHKQLANEQIIMQITNDKLNQEIESKNRELAISTMSIIKKNEVLHKIKKELNKSKLDASNKGAIELIDTNMNNAKDWKFFKQAFNNADKDFLDKIKDAHPDLTPNDLKFCAYLRLNLSSKEIAPLLNISVKSVETKRYRLRKRLNLEHDDSLVNYILKF